MKSIKAHISSFLTIVILAASLLPALHVFNHELSAESETSLTHKFSKESVDCKLCDFRIAASDGPSFFTYEIYSPHKETAYNISLAGTVNLYYSPLFSLRAPPVVIS